MLRAPVRKSLIRKITWFGGDRRLVGFAGLLLFCLGMTLFISYGIFWGLPIILPIFLFMIVVWVAREANKADPWMIDIVIRQFRYRKYYAPKSDLGVEHPQIKDYC
ncbi:MAG TPA: VirB3 family type IV secretion system protein [Noviherbaspirillum sp.]|nr:VirB3 family type IV secretion system protein [Noviherbaspirillum sp.]